MPFGVGWGCCRWVCGSRNGVSCSLSQLRFCTGHRHGVAGTRCGLRSSRLSWHQRNAPCLHNSSPCAEGNRCNASLHGQGGTSVTAHLYNDTPVDTFSLGIRWAHRFFRPSPRQFITSAPSLSLPLGSTCPYFSSPLSQFPLSPFFPSPAFSIRPPAPANSLRPQPAFPLWGAAS